MEHSNISGVPWRLFLSLCHVSSHIPRFFTETKNENARLAFLDRRHIVLDNAVRFAGEAVSGPKATTYPVTGIVQFNGQPVVGAVVTFQVG